MIELVIKIINENIEPMSYNIDVFNHTRTIDELENCCDLLCQLKQNHHHRISDDELYDIAKFIKQIYPDSPINWLNTFTRIESLNYLNVLEGNQEREVNVFENINGVIENDNETEVQNTLNEFQHTAYTKLSEKGIIDY